MTNRGKYVLRTGDPVVVVNAEGLEKYKISNGDKGFCNSLITIEDVQYIFYMKERSLEQVVFTADRVAVDEEKVETIRAQFEHEEFNEVSD